MTAVTADNTTKIKTKALDFEGFKATYDVASSTTIYKDTFVGLNATGYLTSYVAPSSATTIVGTSFRGVALEHVDNSSGSDGDKTCSVLTSGYIEYTLTCDRVDIGCPVMVSDNATLSFTASAGHCIGYVVGIHSTTAVVVRLDPWANWSGKYLHVVSYPIDCCQLSKCLLVHETDNAYGMWICRVCGINTEVQACSDTQGIITISHTASTSMGCTVTCVDNASVSEITVADGGQLFLGANTGPTNEDAMILAPAGKRILASVTTASNQGTAETGTIQLFCTFVSN